MIKIRRFCMILMTIFIILSVLSVAGCGSQKENNISEGEAIEIVDKLLAEDIFEYEMIEVDNTVTENILKIYEDNVSVLKSYTGDGISAEEITVVKGNAAKMRKMCDKYLEDKETNYGSYMPEEAEKINKAVVKQYGEITIICISKDSKKAEKIMKN